MTDGKLNRRQILSAGAIIGSAAATGATPASARSIHGEVPWQAGEADAPTAVEPGPYQFFTPEEARFIEAAVARLIPSDDTGPGAIEAGVPTFLDRQLAGSYGRAERWYMLGPWRKGEESQGFQSRLTPAQMYRYAIAAIDAHVRETSPEHPFFASLSSSEQDRLLGDLEQDKVELKNISGKMFFEQLLQNTIEGFFCDPIHGGNKNMVGWRLIGFPGARYDYRDWVGRHGERVNLPPVGIQGRPEWSRT
jgi:gluconate 2-dehydrogenase gamma chain